MKRTGRVRVQYNYRFLLPKFLPNTSTTMLLSYLPRNKEKLHGCVCLRKKEKKKPKTTTHHQCFSCPTKFCPYTFFPCLYFHYKLCLLCNVWGFFLISQLLPNIHCLNSLHFSCFTCNPCPASTQGGQIPVILAQASTLHLFTKGKHSSFLKEK